MILQVLDMKNDKNCNYNSYLDHWEEGCCDTVNFCSEEFCDAFAVVGAHVKEVENESNRYVVPLCLKHTLKKDEAIALREGTLFITIACAPR